MQYLAPAHQHRYHAIVFKHLPASPDFSRSESIQVPGEHTAAAAWQAVYAVLESADGGQYIGGTIKRCSAASRCPRPSQKSADPSPA